MGLRDYYRNAILQRADNSDTLTGGSYETVATISCFIQHTSSTDRVFQNATGEEADHNMWTNYDGDILYGDRIIYAGLKFTVVQSKSSLGISGLGKHKELLLKRVQVAEPN
jgi:SPP1 family predicted phage head-tail adaptor